MRTKYQRALTAALMAEPSYPHVGSSVRTWLPPGYDPLDMRARVGAADGFSRARDALFEWALQRNARVSVYPPDARPEPGTTVLLRRRFGPFRITAPCRVVWTIDRRDTAGFAYGTLPGHPESGEESFVLDRRDDGTWLTIRGFSRPARWYARLGAPLTRLVQRRILATYLRALSPSANASAPQGPASPPERSGGNQR